jgi:hypothetical protein
LPACGDWEQTAATFGEASYSRLCVVWAGAAGIGRERNVGVDFKVIRLGAARAVTKREGEDGWRSGGADVGVFLAKVVLEVDIGIGLELHLNAVVSGSGWCGPGHGCVGGAARATPRLTCVEPIGTLTVEMPNSRNEKLTGIATAGASVELFQICPTTS